MIHNSPEWDRMMEQARHRSKLLKRRSRIVGFRLSERGARHHNRIWEYFITASEERPW